MKLDQIRASFLKYFEEKGHVIVPSSSLLPAGDPTLLFTNAGMNQFKEELLGLKPSSFKRATSCQKCVRAGGKHNDLEVVGRTARHHTFFEMLGNFSFGDYFKEEAIRLAWEYITKVLSLPLSKLYCSVFETDDEAIRYWEKMGVPPERIYRFGEKDNFWSMGETGPCGPCSEIFYDMGRELSCGKPSCDVGCSCDRYIEIWNLVFMQYNRQADGKLEPLAKPSIDTGMGLERIAAVLQGVKSNYETDLFATLIRAIGKEAGVSYGKNPEHDFSLRVMADHLRATVFLIADGVTPENEGRGYVLRRIMRRAIRHATKLGKKEPFIFRHVRDVVTLMSGAYPQVKNSEARIEKMVHTEETKFLDTLEKGLKILNEEMETLSRKGRNIIPGGVVFRLYDTFGFPADLTQLIAEEKKFSIDFGGFENAMEKQRALSQSGAEKIKGGGPDLKIYEELVPKVQTQFLGYHTLTSEQVLQFLVRGGKIVVDAKEGDEIGLIFKATPFYGEAGGQVGDKGVVTSETGEVEILDTTIPINGLLVHHGKVKKGKIQQNQKCSLRVFPERRQSTALNHTATHLLHFVLRDLLGKDVKQAGSLVEFDRLRFDYTFPRPLTSMEIDQIENFMNAKIKDSIPVQTKVTTYDEAMKEEAIALFGEKYGKEVRIVNVGGFSKELCGGTHIENTSEIRFFKIVSESGIAAGIRRIEAITGDFALHYLKQRSEDLAQIEQLLKVRSGEAVVKIEKFSQRMKQLEKEVEQLKARLTTVGSEDVLQKIDVIKGIKVLTLEVDIADPKYLREYADKLKQRLGSGIILLGAKKDGKSLLLLAITKDLIPRFSAKELIKDVAILVGGSGGGREDMAQAGGTKPENLSQAFKKLKQILSQ